jgi:hypothetical protein
MRRRGIAIRRIRRTADFVHEAAGGATFRPSAAYWHMHAGLPQTDWSILSTLLRLAQRDGWRVEFDYDRVQVSSRRSLEGVVVLPCRLMRHARANGWDVAMARGRIGLRHPAVRHAVTLQLEA